MDCISLPHESSLRRMYSSFGLDTEFLPFLKTETSSFTQSERHLSLNMDEIHVITQQIIRDVEHCDLFVDVIITDNYPLNVHLFKLLGDGKQLISRVP